jgi:hypothetical protein
MNIWGVHISTLGAASVAGAATFGSVYKAFKAFDSDQSDEQRHFVRDWLLGLTVDEQKWQVFYRELFAKFFGNKHLSWKCARRSFSLSASLIAAISFVWYLSSPIAWRDITYLDAGWLLRYVGIIVVFGCVADYLSLWKTRIVLTKVTFSQNALLQLAIVEGDFVATTIIYCVTYGIVMFVAMVQEGPLRINDNTILFNFVCSIFAFDINSFYLLYLAGLLTSAWLWVYLIVAYGMRTAGRLPSALKLLSKIQGFEEHPVRTIGYVAAAASTVIVVILTVI